MTTRNVTAADFGSRYEAPGAELVRIACQFQSRILLKSGEMQVNAKSIMGMMAFQPSKGMEIEITAEGCDEEQAVLEIEAFLKMNRVHKNGWRHTNFHPFSSIRFLHFSEWSL